MLQMPKEAKDDGEATGPFRGQLMDTVRSLAVVVSGLVGVGEVLRR